MLIMPPTHREALSNAAIYPYVHLVSLTHALSLQEAQLSLRDHAMHRVS